MIDFYSNQQIRQIYYCINQQMGNDSYQVIKQKFPCSPKWESTLQSSMVINNMSKKAGQKYNISQHFNSTQLQSYIFRKQNPHYLVEVYDIILTQKPQVFIIECMNNQSSLKIQLITQRICYRLADLGVLDFMEMTYVMQICFRALNVLYLHYDKVFYVDQNFICFNLQGKCKLSINEDLSRHCSRIQTSFLPATIIKQLIKLLQERVSQDLPASYIKFKSSVELDKFSQAVNFIQKTRKKFNFKQQYIERLVSKQHNSIQYIIQTKIVKKQRNQSIKKFEKFSLKQSKQKPFSYQYQNKFEPKQDTTDVSFTQLQKLRQIDQMKVKKASVRPFSRLNHNYKSYKSYKSVVA